MTTDSLDGVQNPATPRSRRLRPTTIAFALMLVAAVAWAFAWGSHDHLPPGVRADLGGFVADRAIAIDASTGSLDLSAVDVVPGEVVDIHLVGSAGEPHAFVLTGANSGAEMDTRIDAAGDTIVRLRVPEDGAVNFFCAIPGHENLHGTLVVNPAR